MVCPRSSRGVIECSKTPNSSLSLSLLPLPDCVYKSNCDMEVDKIVKDGLRTVQTSISWTSSMLPATAEFMHACSWDMERTRERVHILGVVLPQGPISHL